MSKIDEMKAEIAAVRQKADEFSLNGFPLQSDYYKGKTSRLLGEYVVLLEAEVERLRDELSETRTEARHRLARLEKMQTISLDK
jgi:hypothetical protein